MKIRTILLTMTSISFAACQSTSSRTQKTTLQTTTTAQTTTGSQTTRNPKKCIEDSKIRIFSSLTEYQGNKESFDSNYSMYHGNIVQFNTSNAIERLEKDSFVSLGSDFIMKMDLRNIQVQYLDRGAFLQLYCLKELDLSHNSLGNLSDGCFDGLQNLEELNLSFNQIQGIPDNGLTFLPLKSLRVLNLSNNQIKSLNRLSFMTLNNLELLNLGHNKIETLDPRVFNYLGALKKLYLNDNLLEDISAEQWKGLINLTDLDLSNNKIKFFDMTNNYSFTNLRTLDISFNSLSYLNVYTLKKVLPNLFILDISDNKWLCEELEIIKGSLSDSKVTLPRPVNCSEVIITSTKRTPAITTDKPPSPAANFKHDYGPQLVYQNKELLESNTKIEEDIQDLRGVLIGLFIFFIVIVIVEALIRLGFFRSWYYSLTGRPHRGYLHTNDDESVGLISR